MSESCLATSEALGRYRRELMSEGFDADQVSSLVDSASRIILENEGLCVLPSKATEDA